MMPPNAEAFYFKKNKFIFNFIKLIFNFIYICVI